MELWATGEDNRDWVKGWNAATLRAADIAENATHGEATRRHPEWPDANLTHRKAARDLVSVAALIREGLR